jgi:PEP-CTERM motif/Matrixin
MKTLSLATALLFGFIPPALANIDIQFDWTYDGGYFSGTNASHRDALAAAAAVFETRLTDTLGAIDSNANGEFDTVFTNPASPGTTITRSNQSIDTDVIRVYVGGYNTDDSSLGLGGPGGYHCSGIACTEADRGQDSTTDFGPWGGTITFNFFSSNDWNYSVASGPSADQYDLYSVALHELGHVLGFGTSDSFAAHVSHGQFSGVATGTVNLDTEDAHWADGTMSTVAGVAQEAAMTPYLGMGQRRYFTDLDFAALSDIGWQVAAVPEADTWAMFVAGLGLIGLVVRRRRPSPPCHRS